MGNLRELANIPGEMVRNMKENGPMDWSVDRVCGKVKKVTAISVNGEMAKLMAMAYIPGSTETDMKESSKIAWKMVKACKNSATEIFIKDIT